MNLTAVTTARHSQGVWVEPSSLRGLHHPIRVAGWQKRLRRSRENPPILGWTWLPLEKKLEQKLQCRSEHGEETINMSEEGDENERRDIANDLLPCSGAFQ